MLSDSPKQIQTWLIRKLNELKLYAFSGSLYIQYMSLLSKSEIQYLQGQKQVSGSYEHKLRSIIKKKVANLIAKEIIRFP